MSVTVAAVPRPYQTWQGYYEPRNRRRWFRSFRVMIEHYARLAERGGADTLEVGGELITLSSHTARWRRVISVARNHFSGKLTYTANQPEEARRVEFWDQLDYLAMSAYMPLDERRANPTVRRLVRAWKRHGYVDQVRSLQRRNDLPVLFTEIGYQSRMGTAARPWHNVPGRVSEVPQRRAYEAFYRVWSRPSWFRGVYWWRWLAGGYDARDGTHSPRGKDAERVMTAWNRAR
jgi:hypothetical protein